jgi:RND family efflux transporter MFP subunit
MKWIIGSLILAGLLTAAFWAYGAFGTTSVVVAAPERREAIRAVYATGVVKAEQMVRLRPELGGEVLQVGVRQGEEVRQGDMVMELEAREAEDAVKEQQARVHEASLAVQDARANYEHELSLLEQGATTQQAVDNLKQTLDRATAMLQTVKTSLAIRKDRIGKGTIQAPISGVVTKVGVNVGDVISANTEAVVILDPSSFKVYADIDELDINRIQPGQEAIIAFDAMPSRRFRSRVERIIPQADEVTKTLPVILTLTDYVPNLSDGLTATVNIVQERRSNALTIPASALLAPNDTSATVYVVNDYSKLELRTIRLGIRGEDYVEVLEGLHEDERVALNPRKEWQPGKSVTIDKKRMKENLRP